MTATPSRHVARDGTVSYKVRFRHGPNKAGTGLRQCSETFTNKADAVRFAKWLDNLGPQEALDKVYESEQQAAVPTLDQLCADHIANLTGVEQGTRQTYTRLWARTWGQHIGRLPANHVTRDHIAQAVNALAQTYSRKSLENQRGLLAGVLARAVDEGHLSRNPAKGIRLPRETASQKEMRILTPAEWTEVEGKLDERYRSFTRFLAATGCRWGEAVALQVGDVSLPNVRIRRALKWSPNGQRVVGPTKTRKSNRTVAVPGELHDEIREACAGKKRDDLVFTAPRGGAILHRTFWSRVWLPAVEHLDPRPRIHDLRHSHASWLLAAGVPIHIVQARLGHESIQTTVDTYGSLLPDAQMQAARAASLVFDRPPELEA